MGYDDCNLVSKLAGIKNERGESLAQLSIGQVGNRVLFHPVSRAVPSALVGLTTGFGMGPGVPPPLSSPTHLLRGVAHFVSLVVSQRADYQRVIIFIPHWMVRLSTIASRLQRSPLRCHNRPILRITRKALDH